MSSTGWDNFWKDQRQSFYAVMRMATAYCVTQLEKVYHLKPTDEILDYGCGPGFVADCLANQKIQITGADINEFFIEECRKNHPASLFLLITTDITANKKILDEQLKEQKFDYILLLSVAQYFNSANDLEQLIGLLSTYMKESGRLIIADVLDENTSSIKDAITLFLHCIKKGRVGAFVGFMSYLMFSNYRTISKQNKLLQVPEQAIRDMAMRNALQCEKVKGLTLQKSRSNYILSHSSVKSSV
ncbi:methyltransferase domain-containing protein [Niastella caeni]|uniref:Methyltransferase domain-containing protein n=1 Tax=Niastella caeni TaxID=2569763 RepID=A0A4S8HNC4_9BACT|nr:methyltransferase domain-containing protein [Niastella caeni]THU35959.1 methyltransferase domain-containing protein [Niastella caeni]